MRFKTEMLPLMGGQVEVISLKGEVLGDDTNMTVGLGLLAQPEAMGTGQSALGEWRTERKHAHPHTFGFSS